MAFDETVADRIRRVLKRRRGITERKMFGGITFLLNGNMCCGVIGQKLVVRLGTKEAARALREPHTRDMDFTGKPLKSMVYVSPAGYGLEEDLQAWVKRSIDYARSLPAK